MVVFGVTAAFSQLHIVHSYEYHHTKGTPWNSRMKAAAQTIQNERIRPLPSLLLDPSTKLQYKESQYNYHQNYRQVFGIFLWTSHVFLYL